MALTDARGRTLAARTVFFRNGWTQGLGLMFRKPRDGVAYVFDFHREVNVGFHMLFVFWPIDVYFLDARKRVVDAKRGFRPFAAYRPRVRFSYALETRAGLLSLREGDTARF